MIKLYIFTVRTGSANTKPQAFIHSAYSLSYAFPWHLALTENDYGVFLFRVLGDTVVRDLISTLAQSLYKRELKSVSQLMTY